MGRMMFFIGFFVGWVIGILSALLFLYIIRSELEQVADGERLCSKENPVRWADTFYVEVATGKYHFASDLIKEYGRQTLGKLVAEGTFVTAVTLALVSIDYALRRIFGEDW